APNADHLRSLGAFRERLLAGDDSRDMCAVSAFIAQRADAAPELKVGPDVMDRPKPRSQLLFLGGELYFRAPFRFGGGDGRIAPWLGNTTLACASKSLFYPSRRSFGFLFRKALGGTLIDGYEHLN